MGRRRGMRGRMLGMAGALTLTLAALAGCGTRGYAPPLSKPATATFSGSAGTVTLTAVYGMHILNFLHGAQVPASDEKIPIVLRRDACDGPTVAVLTKAATGDVAATPAADSAIPAATRATDDGGIDVALQQGTQWHVVVLGAPHDPKAEIVACGEPISDRAQYFDLWPSTLATTQVAIGATRMQPIEITKLGFALAGNADVGAAWSLRKDGCDGATVAEGRVPTGGESDNGGYAFAAPDVEHWWLRVQPSGAGALLCAQVRH